MMLTEYEHQQSSLTGPNPQKTIFGSKATPPPPGLPGLVIFEKKVGVTKSRASVDQLRGKWRR